MSAAMDWMENYGFQLIESVGVIASLCFSAAAFRTSSRITQAENLVRVTESHRALWLYFSDHPELERVLKPQVNLAKQPVKKAERRFVILLIAHVVMAFKTNKSHLKVKPEGQDRDIGELFSLPIPGEVWREIRHLQDTDFVTYVNDCLQRWSTG